MREKERETEKLLLYYLRKHINVTRVFLKNIYFSNEIKTYSNEK